MSRSRLMALQDYLHARIPLTRAMAIEVESYLEGTLVITAPLEPNHNHLGTAFGGSLAAIATLAGYALLWLELQDDPDCHLVVAETAMRFRRPVRGRIRAVCRRPEEARWSTFLAAFLEKGKARLDLPVTIEESGLVCVEFRGTFVAMR